MNIKLLPLILVLLFSYITSFSQTAPRIKKNNIEFSTGHTIGALKNLEIAPLARYDYNGLNYRLNYQRLTKKEKIVELQLDYIQSDLRSALLPDLNLGYERTSLNISYLKKAYAKNNFILHLGLYAQTNISAYSKENNTRSLAYQTFGLAGRFAYQINGKHRLSSKLAVPLVLFRGTHASSGIYTLNRYQSILLNLKYTYSFSKRFDATLSYDFNYDRLQIPSAYRELQHQISLGINYKF